MARPKVHYSMVIKNHETGARLKVELVDLPFQESRLELAPRMSPLATPPLVALICWRARRMSGERERSNLPARTGDVSYKKERSGGRPQFRLPAEQEKGHGDLVARDADGEVATVR